jgi:hypothetical protein
MRMTEVIEDMLESVLEESQSSHREQVIAYLRYLEEAFRHPYGCFHATGRRRKEVQDEADQIRRYLGIIAEQESQWK